MVSSKLNNNTHYAVTILKCPNQEIYRTVGCALVVNYLIASATFAGHRNDYMTLQHDNSLPEFEIKFIMAQHCYDTVEDVKQGMRQSFSCVNRAMALNVYNETVLFSYIISSTLSELDVLNSINSIQFN